MVYIKEIIGGMGVEIEKMTYAAGHILVSTKTGILFWSMRGLDGPKTCVKCIPVSRAIYVVAAKKTMATPVKGYG